MNQSRMTNGHLAPCQGYGSPVHSWRFQINVIIAVAGDIAAILGSKKLVAPLITETTSSE
jgi:hypothetical protein